MNEIIKQTKLLGSEVKATFVCFTKKCPQCNTYTIVPKLTYINKDGYWEYNKFCQNCYEVIKD